MRKEISNLINNNTRNFHSYNLNLWRICVGKSTKKLTTEIWIVKAKEIYGDKFDYSKTQYINARTKVNIICNTCKQNFLQLPSLHLEHNGCPNCSKNKRLTQEEVIAKFKEVHGDKFDFYLKDYSLCIEYQGNIHYRPHSFSSDQSEETKIKNLKEVQYRDSIKKKWCKNNGIRFLEISYLQFKNIEVILKNEIKVVNSRECKN